MEESEGIRGEGSGDVYPFNLIPEEEREIYCRSVSEMIRSQKMWHRLTGGERREIRRELGRDDKILFGTRFELDNRKKQKEGRMGGKEKREGGIKYCNCCPHCGETVCSHSIGKDTIRDKVSIWCPHCGKFWYLTRWEARISRFFDHLWGCIN